jgi:hypothetical protein
MKFYYNLFVVEMVAGMKTIKSFLYFVLCFTLIFQNCTEKKSAADQKLTTGLIGAFYGNADLSNIKSPEILHTFDNYWDEDTGHGSEWSGKWEGMLTAPKTDLVTLYLESNKRAEFYFDDKQLMVGGEKNVAKLQIEVNKNRCYPIMVIYYHLSREPGYLKISWSWGDEILVGFTLGHYKENLLHHSIDESKPSLAMLSRSLNGGETWKTEYPETYPGDGRKALPAKDKIDFSHPDLAIRCTREAFFVSYDRGKKWEGPYIFPKFDQEKLTSRTDYIPINKNKCLFFLSAEDESIEAQLQDRAFAAGTINEGRTIKFLSWICPPTDTYRSVMPSSVQLEDGTIITTLRRRYDQRFGDEKPKLATNWIDAYQSKDLGKSWQFLSRVAETDMGKHNGNPPRLIRLKDGRLCVTYGYRAVPYGIRAKLSSDYGKTWGDEIHLRDHGREFDIGYTRAVQRTDGKIVTIYYFTTSENYEQHIAATIWDPNSIKHVLSQPVG